MRLMTLRLLALTVLQMVATAAAACRFAQDAQPAQWYEWSNSLFAAEVISVAPSPERALDVITVRVMETFKGPEGARATLQVPSRMWTSCRLERPLAGARVLVALNPHSDMLLVPLTQSYSELLRQHRGKGQAPASMPPSAQTGDKPFTY
jgi:hypothetical protein